MLHPSEPLYARPAFVCPDCGCMKDGWDVKAGQWRKSAWCHAWPLHVEHGHHGRRKMRAVSVLMVGEQPGAWGTTSLGAVVAQEEDR